MGEKKPLELSDVLDLGEKKPLELSEKLEDVGLEDDGAFREDGFIGLIGIRGV